MKMVLPRWMAYIAVLILVCFALPDAAFAQAVESMLEQAGDGISGWVSAAAILLCVIVGVGMMKAGFQIAGLLIPIIGFVIATNPDEIRAWLP